jgi:predicted dehydrogenase
MKNPPASWEGSLEACDIEDFNIGLVHFADGSTMTIESNWLMHPRPRPLRLELEEDGHVVDATPALPENPPDAFGQICLDFYQSIIENRVPLVRFDEMLDVQRIMDALYAAAEQGREFDITD